MKQLEYISANRIDWKNVPEPEINGAGQAILKPVSIARCDLDLPIIHGKTLFRGVFPLGHEWIGEIVEVSPDLQEKFKKGSRYGVTFQISCGHCFYCSSNLSNSCEQAHGGGNYGMGPSGKEYGGALCDLVKVPFAEQMLIPFPGELDPVDWASWSDNISESWKMVGQFLENGKSNRVLIMGGFAFSIALYCVILAKGMGAYVEYWDEDRGRLDKAEALGAKVVQVDWEKSNTIPKDRFSIVADASGSEAAFSLGMRHLTPGGDFTTAGIYWTNKILIPFLELYNTGASIHITRVSSRETMPKLLEKFQKKIFDPGKVRPVVALLADSKEAWQEPATKLVIKNY